mgnify:CR=1 FL=1
MKSRREGRSGNRRPFGVGGEPPLCTCRKRSLRTGRDRSLRTSREPFFAYGQGTVLCIRAENRSLRTGRDRSLRTGREPFFAYRQRTAESRISGEGGERRAGAQRAFPRRKGAVRGYEAGGPGTGTCTLNGRFRILPARSFLRAAALIYKA